VTKLKKDFDNIFFINNNENLDLATIFYNKGDMVNTTKYYNYVQLNRNTTSDPNSWYKVRDLAIEIYPTLDKKQLNNLTNNILKNNYIEDINCVNNLIHHKISDGICTQMQLMDISHSIHDLIQSGNTSDFYNTEFKMLSLQKPEDLFVTYLNYFIIGSMIAGPVIFTITTKHIVK
jgi:hypothetical protein